jgi:hypothetical protein
VDRIDVEIEKLREQLRKIEELRSMQESANREREGRVGQNVLRVLSQEIYSLVAYL